MKELFYGRNRGDYMKATGIIRRFDDLGRIVIPKEIRKQIFGSPDKAEGMPMEIFMEGNDVVLRKYEPVSQEGGE